MTQTRSHSKKIYVLRNFESLIERQYFRNREAFKRALTDLTLFCRGSDYLFIYLISTSSLHLFEETPNSLLKLDTASFQVHSEFLLETLTIIWIERALKQVRPRLELYEDRQTSLELFDYLAIFRTNLAEAEAELAKIGCWVALGLPQIALIEVCLRGWQFNKGFAMEALGIYSQLLWGDSGEKCVESKLDNDEKGRFELFMFFVINYLITVHGISFK